MNSKNTLCRRLAAFLPLLAAAQLHAQAPAAKPDAAALMAALQPAYQAASDAVAADREKWLAALDAWYLNGLDALLKDRASNADLDGAVATRSERERFIAHRETSADELHAMPPALRTLRGTYDTTMRKVVDEVAKRNAAANQKHLADLEALQKDLTKQGEIEQAIAVKTARERFAADLALSTAPPWAAPAAAPAAPPSAPAAPAPVANAEGKEYITLVQPAHSESPIVLHREDKIFTPEKFRPPVEITVIARTEDTNIRVGYAADQVIFNWERVRNELRVDGGPASGKHKPGAGSVPVKQDVTIRWRVVPGKQSIWVDDELRYEHVGDYSKINNPVSVGTHKSAVTVKSIKVQPLPAGAQ